MKTELKPCPLCSYEEPLGRIETALMFAARYTHNRATGGTMMVIQALEQCWDQITEEKRRQILRESEDATANKDEWREFRAKKGTQ